VKIFDLDGPFQKYGTIVFDILVMNTLWFLLTFFSVGLLSGPALTGTYAGIYSGVVTNEGYTFKQFFVRFKRRFLISFIFGLLSLFIISISFLNLYLVLTSSFGTIWLLPVYMFVLIESSVITAFGYPLLAHTDLKLKDLIKTAFYLANKHLPTAVITAILNGIIFSIILLVVGFGYVSLGVYLFVITGVIVSINSYLITKRILSKYDFFVKIEY
jgi:uncharacterized membrane protein YesL